jgi:hypothetical protein
VGARDPSNGIEDPANYRYWDGKIIKGSDNILGPYKYQNQTYAYQNGKGHKMCTWRMGTSPTSHSP